MSKILSLAFGIKDVKFRNDDEFVDRLTRRHTTYLLLIFSVVVTTQQYVGSPIHCWCPGQFTGTHVSYTNTICWVKNTYYVTFDDDLPGHSDPSNKRYISYYQWIPLILLCQACLCYFPSVLWNFLSRRSGMNIAAMMEAAIQGNRTTYAEMREKTIQYVVDYINKYLVVKQKTEEMICGSVGHFFHHCSSCNSYGGCTCSGSYLTGAYFFVKILYVANAIGQLFLLNLFLGTDYHVYGIEVVQRFINKDDWTKSHRFPRETICDFRMRHMNAVQRWVVQCALPINLFSEKIFIFLWFWFALLSFISVITLIKWCYELMFWSRHVTYVKHTLNIWMSFEGREKEVAKKFCVTYLRRDGMFLIKLIRSNVGHLIAAEVLKGLYDITSTSMKDTLKRRNAMTDTPRFKQMVDTMVLNRRPSSNPEIKVEAV